MSVHLTKRGSALLKSPFLTSSLTASKSGGASGTAGFQVNTDGILYRAQNLTLNPTWVAQSTDGWLRRGSSSSYDVRFTRTSGDTSGMTTGSATSGTWYNLATSKHVGYSASSGESWTGVWTIDIALSTDHATILATASASISASAP